MALEAACMASVQDKLDEIYARIEAGEDFDALIAEYGEDAGMQSEPAKSTGYYVCADSTSLDLPFKTAAMLLEKVGDVSEPTLGQYGVHIIRYESDVTPGAVAFEQVQAALTEEALTQQQELHYQEKLEAWLSDLNVVYHYDAWKAYESNALQ